MKLLLLSLFAMLAVTSATASPLPLDEGGLSRELSFRDESSHGGGTPSVGLTEDKLAGIDHTHDPSSNVRPSVSFAISSPVIPGDINDGEHHHQHKEKGEKSTSHGHHHHHANRDLPGFETDTTIVKKFAGHGRAAGGDNDDKARVHARGDDDVVIPASERSMDPGVITGSGGNANNNKKGKGKLKTRVVAGVPEKLQDGSTINYSSAYAGPGNLVGAMDDESRSLKEGEAEAVGRRGMA